MRVTLLHNKTAGSENHAAEELEAIVRRAGHEVVATVTNHEELISSIGELSPELIAIAGGDGTVSRAACALGGYGVPLAILPLGTANNTALTLGVLGHVDALVERWSSGRLLPFDLATVATGDTLASFSEAVGWGVFPSVMANTARMSWPDEPRRTLERDRSVFQAVIEASEARSYEIVVDGVSVTGKFLLVEVVNIPLIGPQLAVSPDSDPTDGLLEVVVASESERGALLELAATGRVAPDRRLRTLRGTRITVQTDDRAYHRDGSLVERTTTSGEFSLGIVPGSVRYLLHPERV
jgi:diacylglycerol kinase family enzyme